MNRNLFLGVSFVLLALVIGVSGVAAQGRRPDQRGTVQAANLTFNHFFLMNSQVYPTPWWQSNTVVDAIGGVHTTFYTEDYIYYAYCPADCGDPAHWLELPIAGTGSLDPLDLPMVAVDSNGHPRLMWWYKSDSGDYTMAYAECNSNCTVYSQWTVIQAFTTGSNPAIVGYFALDDQGRPRLVEVLYNGIWWERCNSNCTNPANWVGNRIEIGRSIGGPRLVLDQAGMPRVVGRDTSTDELVYLECNQDCHLTANWASVVIAPDVFQYVLRLDSQGRPRVAYYKTAGDAQLYYTWNNGDPLAVGD